MKTKYLFVGGVIGCAGAVIVEAESEEEAKRLVCQIMDIEPRYVDEVHRIDDLPHGWFKDLT